MITINRYYNRLKFFRTYIGGSKKKELNLFLNAQGDQIDWFEFRKLVILNFEDVLHVTFSRKFATKRLSFWFLGISFCMILFKIIILAFICFGLALISQIFFNYFRYREGRNIVNYDIIIRFTNNFIRQEFGINLPEIT